ncbi:MAG: hypothetical protein Q7S46_11740 [Gallionella sp.]|nr:hypothetical protein [Gallionella sp.]
MATISNNAASANVVPLPTVALVPGKPESKMRLSTIVKKERQEQKEQDKKLDAPQKQPQSSTVVNISAKAIELNRAAPVDQASSAVKVGSSTDQVVNISAKDKDVNSVAPTAQPLPAINIGSPAASSKKV